MNDAESNAKNKAGTATCGQVSAEQQKVSMEDQQLNVLRFVAKCIVRMNGRMLQDAWDIGSAVNGYIDDEERSGNNRRYDSGSVGRLLKLTNIGMKEVKPYLQIHRGFTKEQIAMLSKEGVSITLALRSLKIPVSRDRMVWLLSMLQIQQ